MHKIASVLISTKFSSESCQDTFVDRLSSVYTVHVLAAFAILVFAQVYVGSPIICWTPAEFTDAHDGFTDSYCYVSNTYHNPIQRPLDIHPDDQKYIPYYQWIPFILIGMAVLFYLPKVFWKGTNQKVGIDADDILESAHSCDTGSKFDEREGHLQSLVYQFDRCMTFHPKLKIGKTPNAVKIINGGFGNYLCLMFTLSKFLYAFNITIQLFALNWVLAVDYSLFGIETIMHLMRDFDWTDAKEMAFPRVTYCDIPVRKIGGNLHTYTVQCTLPINMYNEKIFLFMWFWLMFLLVVTVGDIIQWLMRMSHTRDKKIFVANHLDLVLDGDVKRKDIRNDLRTYIEDYLKADGILLLQLISHNCTRKTVTDINSRLWKCWSERRREVDKPLFDEDDFEKDEVKELI